MPTTKKSPRKKPPPWTHAAPKNASHSSLTPAQKKRARARAQKAGRSYPNLVDNMHEAAAQAGARKKATVGSAAAKKASKRAPAKPAKKAASKRAPVARTSAQAPYTVRRARTKDPKGGLTAAGRRAFHERDGANLKPGVTKPMSQMTAAEMRRKGSWAARFYGRSGALPPLLDDAGKPTRFALTAAAWGERVPKTASEARAIAAKGRRLLERARTKGR